MILRSCSRALCWGPAPLLRTLVCSRAVSTSRSRRKDEDAPARSPDLDVWKSVMRSQALQEERRSEEDPGPGRSDLDELRQLVETWHVAGRAVPQNITEEELEELGRRSTKSAMKKYLRFLTIKEGHKLSRKRKQELKRAEAVGRPELEVRPEAEEQREMANSFLLGFWTKAMERAQGWRAAQAMMFGQPLVLDMSFEHHMIPRDLQNTVEQLQEVEGWNRRLDEPFHLHFCGLQPDGAFQRLLLQRYGPDTWQRLFITASARSHVELFPRRDLVYLTPDSHNVLHTFDRSKVYIVGAMVDRSVQTGVTLASAKRLQLPTARLPLQEYLDWGCGAKSLTLDQMIRILGTLKETGSWKKALEFVPKRKHQGFHQDKSRAFTGPDRRSEAASARAQKNKINTHRRDRER